MEQEKNTPTTERPQSKFEDLSIPIAIILAGVLIAGAIIFSDSKGTTRVGVNAGDQQEQGSDSVTAPDTVLALTKDDHVLGNTTADILLIEYSDTECPFCKRFHSTMLQVMGNDGKNGTIAWVYRHWPLDQLHPKARKEAEALECANELGGNNAFWKYVDQIFEITPGNNGLDAAQLPVIASTIGLDTQKFNACLASGKYETRVQKDFESGITAGVRGTPYTIAYNRKTGKQLPINGALSYQQVKGIIAAISAP